MGSAMSPAPEPEAEYRPFPNEEARNHRQASIEVPLMAWALGLPTGGRVLAVRPRVDRPYATVEVAAIAPSGRKVPLLKLRSVRPEWPRRYWLFDAIDLPAGSRIEMTTTPGDPDAGPLAPPVSSPLQLALDINVP